MQGGFYQPGGFRTPNRANDDDGREMEKVSLRLQIIMLKTRLEEVSKDFKDLQAVSLEVRQLVLSKDRKISELSVQCASWEKKCVALEEELSKKLSEKEQRHTLDLAKRDDYCRKAMSQQAEMFQRELSERDSILQNHLSERDARLLELRRLMEENTELKVSCLRSYFNSNNLILETLQL